MRSNAERGKRENGREARKVDMEISGKTRFLNDVSLRVNLIKESLEP